MILRERLLAALGLLIASATLTCSVSAAHAAAFTAGNLAIYRTGDGTADLINTGSKVFIDEYTPAGVLVQSIEMPSAAVSGLNLIASGTASSEGLLNRSADGSKLVITGYNATIPTTGLAGTAGATTNRVVGTLDLSGAASLYGFSDLAGGNNPRSAVIDGNKLFLAGGAGGVRYQDLSTLVAGSTGNTSTQLSATVTNIRHVDIFSGQLYVSDNSGTAVRIGTVGTGEPTASGETISTLPGVPLTGSPYQFALADLDAGVAGVDTLYASYDDAVALTKFSLVAGTWTSNGSIGVAGDAYRGITLGVSGSTVTIFATRKGGTGATGGGEFVSLVDASGYNGAFTGTPTLLATATTKTAFRGIDFVPSSSVTPPTNNADFNNDLVVDGLDFLIWQQGNGLTGVPTNDKSTGDANGDHAVDDLDLGIWKTKFGGAPAVGAVGAVPEPASLSLGLAAIFGLAGLRRRAKNS